MSKELKKDSDVQNEEVQDIIEDDSQELQGTETAAPDSDTDTDTKAADPKKKKKKKDPVDSIDVMEMTPDDVAGLVIGLNPNDTLWRMETYPDSGQYLVDLNRFSGKISQRLPATLTKDHAESILASLQLGTIRVYSKEVSAEPAVKSTEDIMNPLSIEARKFISELDLETFKTAVANINREELVYRCIDLEKREKNREEFLKVLRARAKEITG